MSIFDSENFSGVTPHPDNRGRGGKREGLCHGCWGMDAPVTLCHFHCAWWCTVPKKEH